MRLVRADVSTSVFAELERQWAQQCVCLGEAFEDFAKPSMDHARKIANDKGPTEHYAIYALLDDMGNMHCVSHVNVAALRRTKGDTLRVLWVLLAPKYDFEDVSPESLALIGSEMLGECIALASGRQGEHMAADHVKLHLGGLGDRQYLSGLVREMNSFEGVYDVGFRSNWLHLSVNQSLAVAS